MRALSSALYASGWISTIASSEVSVSEPRPVLAGYGVTSVTLVFLDADRRDRAPLVFVPVVSAWCSHSRQSVLDSIIFPAVLAGRMPHDCNI